MDKNENSYFIDFTKEEKKGRKITDDNEFINTIFLLQKGNRKQKNQAYYDLIKT